MNIFALKTYPNKARMLWDDSNLIADFNGCRIQRQQKNYDSFINYIGDYYIGAKDPYTLNNLFQTLNEVEGFYLSIHEIESFEELKSYAERNWFYEKSDFLNQSFLSNENFGWSYMKVATNDRESDKILFSIYINQSNERGADFLRNFSILMSNSYLKTEDDNHSMFEIFLSGPDFSENCPHGRPSINDFLIGRRRYWFDNVSISFKKVK